jgi:two-component system OmpR family sensor kinase
MSRGGGSSRLYRRIYLHGVLLLFVVATTLGIAGFFVGRDAPWRGRPARLAAPAARLLAALPDEALRGEVLRLGGELPAMLAVFRDDGRLLAATERSELRPLPADEVARLHSAPGEPIERHLSVAMAAGENRYLRLSLHPRHDAVLRRVAAGLFVVLLALAAASWPLARAIARPIEALGDTARRLGAGDLSVRSGLTRNDEIGELARAFDEMADRIGRVVQAQREMVAAVSHELRTPLARIRVTLGLATEAEPARARAYLAEIETDVGELERLVGDVLVTSRLDAAGALALRRERLEARAIVERALQRFARLHPHRRVDAFVADTPAVAGDPALLDRALDNLLDNAARYSDPGTPLRVALSAADGGSTIEIQDHGIGIAPEDQQRLFTSFFRADRSRARNTGGVGLGLAISKRVVDAHGGRLSLESRPGEGTTVRLWLPSAPT